MSYTVKWLPEAELTYALVLEYLDENWTTKEIEKFIDRTDEVINFISQNPEQYFYLKKKNSYRAVVTKHVSLYYKIQSTEIELLIFWDNRQDPEKLKL
ncbi:type II toxin-antitoxin system RelE/ParE family toxin [Marivirga sp.]|uniref:type II toxin-antitoxin system RelE/ParE family toxin n=1 Tax=Marivirga sp. TaxID=2018662 RepID=UPI003DA7403A